MSHTSVVVFGASGFVGSAVADAVEAAGATVLRRSAPRLTRLSETRAMRAPTDFADMVTEVAELLPAGCTVVNAAGMGEATHGDEMELMAANCGVAGILAAAARARGARFVHVSSAAVQGRNALDDSDRFATFSAYSRSKAAGERSVRQAHPDAVVYRPPGVHGVNRDVTRSVARLARSRLSSVAAPGTDNSAQALIENVAAACVFLALSPNQPPSCVSHPSEGMTTAGLLMALGERSPILVPRSVARASVVAARLVGRMAAPLAAHARRVEILWFGQVQGPSWLTSVGWSPVVDHSGWYVLGKQFHNEKDST